MIRAGHLYKADTSTLADEQRRMFFAHKFASGQLLSQAEFQSSVFLDSYLEEGETLEEMLRSDPDTRFFTLQLRGVTVIGLSYAGSDILFSPGACAIPLLKTEPTSEFCAFERNALAWVLAPVRSACLPKDRETERCLHQTGLIEYLETASGDLRLRQLDMEGNCIAGLATRRNTIESIFVMPAHTRRKLASKLVDLAMLRLPDLQHSDSLTHDGRRFVCALSGSNDSQLTP